MSIKNPFIKCKQCETYNAYKILEEGRYFIHCVHCGYHDYLKTFNKKTYEQTPKQLARQSRR